MNVGEGVGGWGGGGLSGGVVGWDLFWVSVAGFVKVVLVER